MTDHDHKDLAAFPNRYAVEREIEAAENPAPGAMHLNDGHERVRLPGGTLRRMLAVIDHLAAMASSAQQGEPAAWMHWMHGPVRVFMKQGEAALELERLERSYPSEGQRKMRPLVYGDTRPTAPAEPADLRAFLDAAAGEGLVLAGVDAADLCVRLFPEHYAALQANDTTKGK